jgi:hypothetical protein
MNEIKLYFGLSKQDNSLVSEEEFTQFIEEEVLPYFPNITVLDGVGYWRKQREDSKTVIINDDYDNYHIREHIDQICIQYCGTFKQEYVLVSYTPIDTRLHGKTSVESK